MDHRCAVDVRAGFEHRAMVIAGLERYERAAGVDACDELRGATIVVTSTPRPSPRCSNGDTCVERVTWDLFHIHLHEASRFPVVDALAHEAVHVALWRRGVPAGERGAAHHRWMAERGITLTPRLEAR